MYIDHVKYYSNHSKWLAKLFLQFCHEYKFHLLMFETSESSVKQLVSELKKEGTRNDKRLKNIFKKIINN